MQDYFRIRVGGSGNITSVAWEDGDLTPSEVASRNSTVDAENPNTVKSRLLGVFQSVDELQEWATALNNEFVSKGRKMDMSLSDAIGEALHMLTNGAGVVFIDAIARMCNASLIHLTGIKSSDPKTPPQINEGIDVDYDNESHKILLSNGGTISADVEQGENKCVFYHPPAWIYRAYMIEDAPFVGWFEYDSATYEKTIGNIVSQIVYKQNYHIIATFAWFGEENSNRMLNTAIPSAYIKNTLGWSQRRRFEDGRSGSLCYLGDEEPSRYTWGNLTTYSFSEYTKPSVLPNIPLFIFYHSGWNDGVFQQLELPSYTPAENSLFSPSRWSEVWYSAVYAFWWNYTNAYMRGGFLVKTPFYRNAYDDFYYQDGTIPTIGDVISWIPSITWDGMADEFYNALFSTYGLHKVGEYASTYSGTKVGGFVCYVSNETLGYNFHESNKILDFAHGRTSSYPIGKFTGQSQGTTVFYTSEAALANEQPASAVTIEQHTSNIELIHRVQFAFQTSEIVATVMLYGNVSPYWNLFSPTRKVEAVRSTIPLTIYLTFSSPYLVLDTIEWYADDPNETYRATITDGVVTISIEEVLRAYGISLNTAEVEEIPRLFKNGKIPIHFKMNQPNGSLPPNVASFFVGGELMGEIINEWRD